MPDIGLSALLSTAAIDDQWCDLVDTSLIIGELAGWVGVALPFVVFFIVSALDTFLKSLLVKLVTGMARLLGRILTRYNFL